MEAEHLQAGKASASLLPGQLKLLARPEGSDAIEVLVPMEATVPLLRALRRTLEAVLVPAEDLPWLKLFEAFGATGGDGPGECGTCGLDGEALRVRLAVAEARLAARQPPQEERDLSRLTTAVEQVPVERQEIGEPAQHTARAEVPTPAEDLSPARNFSLSAELWRLREALAKANGAKDKACDVEVQRLRRALDKSQQKLQHYEESNEGSLTGSTDFCPQALKSEILDAVRKEQEACKDRRATDARHVGVEEPDTARTRVAHNDEPRPSKPDYAQGLQGTVIKVVKVPHTPSGHATSPSPMRPTSPLRKTRVIAMSPPTRVQLSPHPWRGRLTDTPGMSFREVPSSAAAMAAHAIAATSAMVGTPSRPLPTQSPPRPERHWPRSSSATKPTSPQVPHVASRSVATPAKRVTWTTPRVAPPPLVSNSVTTSVRVSSPQASRTPWSVAAPVVLPEAFSPQRVRIASPSVVEIRSKVSPVRAI